MEGSSSATWAASKSDFPMLLHDGMVVWNNLAFSHDEVEEDEEESAVIQENCSISSTPAAAGARGTASDHEGSVVIKHVVEEEDQEMKFREELENEMEKQLEHEIMEGILDLVRKLSSLKAKRIIRSLKKFDVDDLLSILYGSSFDFSCKTGDDHEDLCFSPTQYMTQLSNEFEEQLLEDSKKNQD